MNDGPLVRIVYRGRGDAFDAIAEHSRRLARALSALDGQHAQTLIGDASGRWTVEGEPPERAVERARLADRVAEAEAIVVQYNPFSYGRWGFAPWLPALLIRVRRRRPRPRIVLMVHEPFVPLGGMRQAAIGAWQRAQLAALARTADTVAISTGELRARMRPYALGRAAVHLPVGSNLPDRRADRAGERQARGLGPSDFVIATFGMRHEGRLTGHLTRAVNAIASLGASPVLLNLGASPPSIDGIDARVRTIQPGPLEASALARLLAASDLFLGAYRRGASTRRTTLMAALQHGIAVVATAGPETDAVLGALRLVPGEDAERFALAASELAADDAGRRRVAAAGRALYETAFDWPAIARRLRSIIDQQEAGAPA